MANKETVTRKEPGIRFYRTVSITQAEKGFGIALDRLPVKTPGQAILLMASRSLAEAIAAEWETQQDIINPTSMPLSRLLNTSIDRTTPNRTETISSLLHFIDTDTLCYRADSPQALVDRQLLVWQPVLDWLSASHSIKLQVAVGVMHHGQSSETFSTIEKLLSAYDDITLTAVQAITSLTSSLVLSVAMADQFLSGREVAIAAQLEENWQIEQWGEDSESLKRREELNRAILAIERFISLTR
ncbi:MAG: ATP12 family chaperone protein [Rhodospirillaceae bacterium]